MFNSGLLVLTSPFRILPRVIAGLLVQCEKLVSETLFISINPDITSGCGSSRHEPATTTTTSSVSHVGQFIADFYKSTSINCERLDCYVLLNDVRNFETTAPHTAAALKFDVMLLEDGGNVGDDNSIDEDRVRSTFIDRCASSNESKPSVKYLKSERIPGTVTSGRECAHDKPSKIYKKGVLGGTFDRMHIGHKVLLSEACLRCNEILVVGVTEISERTTKLLPELIEPLEKRMSTVRRMINTIKPSLKTDIVPLLDLFGPSTVYPDLECIFVSHETEAGARLVNAERIRKGLKALDIITVDLVTDGQSSSGTKISSSCARKALLGRLLQEPTTGKLATHPYRIGLTGGSGSGKSSVAKRLAGLGAGVIDCDKLGHMVYTKGSECFHRVVSEFGNDIIGPSGEIDRSKLGAKVFSDKEKLRRLNRIVWPEILKAAEEKLDLYRREGKAVVVFDAAVLLEAGWDEAVHEVWACVIPRSEAIARITHRDGKTEEAAARRLDSQMRGCDRVKRANVVISTQWDYECTQRQVELSWRLLMERIAKLTCTVSTSDIDADV